MTILAVILVLALAASVGAYITIGFDTPQRRARNVCARLRRVRSDFNPDRVFVCPFEENAIAFDLSTRRLCLVSAERTIVLAVQQLSYARVYANGGVVSQADAGGRRGDRAAIERVLSTGLTELRIEIRYRAVEEEQFAILLADLSALKTGATTAGAAVEQGVDCFALLADWVALGARLAQRERRQFKPSNTVPPVLEVQD